MTKKLNAIKVKSKFYQKPSDKNVVRDKLFDKRNTNLNLEKEGTYLESEMNTDRSIVLLVFSHSGFTQD